MYASVVVIIRHIKSVATIRCQNHLWYKNPWGETIR